MPALNRREFLRLSAAGSAAALFGSGCRRDDSALRGRIHLTYWEKWTGEEGEAIRKVVDDFNRSQDRIYVEYLNMSHIDRKVIIATAGGMGPDIAGVWSHTLSTLADLNALMPLDELMAAEPEGPAWMNRFYPAVAGLMRHRGQVYGLPSMHMVSALFWNKTMFREAGLDPERPPQTLREFDEFNRLLTRKDPHTGRLKQAGFLSSEPNFVNWQYLNWFGGQSWDGEKITIATDPGNLAALQWIRAKTEEVGLQEFRIFASGAAGSSSLSFSSPNNPFYTGKLGMTFYGVWFYSYLRRFAPGLDWGCAPWPEVVPGIRDYTYVESDILVVPRGCRHPEAAWKFLRYVTSANLAARSEAELRGVEKLGWLQRRPSSLRAWSPFLAENHPNPQIEVFRRLSDSPNAARIIPLGIAREYIGENLAMFERVRNLSQKPEDALRYVHGRLSESWATHQRSLRRHGLLA
ncbi:ABC transporter substrate-binding protein [Oleiharenicola lentus]|uniref:ABC transporter substrate-binding protein n=1 Tax=Oleiharenicola lentus TaxID=2508720 RepID=A0A4V1M6R9_9BACT|nr:ABC transporter substrate-binding protein [Oleiharenicola lentus]RXK56359.1 ABC transporter substrate-binding protein [Oleiharenicola lentus]